MKTDDERLELALREFAYYINEPGPRWPESEFNNSSFSRSAVDEVYIMMGLHPEWSVMKCVEEVKNIMHNGMLNPEFRDMQHMIYVVGYDTLCDISDILGGII